MKTRIGYPLLALPLLAAASAHSLSQTSAPPPPFLRHTFEESDGGWTAFGNGGKVAVTKDPARVKEGKGTLQFEYNVAKGEMGALLLPINEAGYPKLKSIRFWARADANAPVAVTLQEKDGGRYTALFTAPKDVWQRVELALSDFVLSEDPNDPKDSNGKLDLDRIEAIAITDAGQFIAQGPEELTKLFNIKTGARTLLIDDFQASEEAVPSAFPAAGGETRLDTFARPQVGWMVVGDAKTSVGVNKPMEGRSLLVEYKQAPGQLVGLVRPFPRGRLVGAGKLAFDAASAHGANLVVQVEEKGGGKYNVLIDVPGEKTVKTFTVDLAGMMASQDSNDSNGKLDLDQVKQLVIIDVSGIAGAETPNQLWIGNLRVLPK